MQLTGTIIVAAFVAMASSAAIPGVFSCPVPLFTSCLTNAPAAVQEKRTQLYIFPNQGGDKDEVAA